MPVNAKKVVFCGLLLALTEVCIAMSSVIETNTLFLLAVSAFCVGIVIRETDCKYGTAFYFAGIVLGVFLAPNKFYVISYAGMGLYILGREVLFEKLTAASKIQNKMRAYRLAKQILFNIIYIPGIVFGWQLIIAKEVNLQIMIIVIFVGQLGWYLYDKAYEYTQTQIWSKLRVRLLK